MRSTAACFSACQRATCAGVAVCHTVAVLSQLAVISRWPSGEKATAKTAIEESRDQRRISLHVRVGIEKRRAKGYRRTEQFGVPADAPRTQVTCNGGARY